MEAKRLALDAGMTEPVLCWQAQGQPYPPASCLPVGARTSRLPSKSPTEARMRIAQEGVVAQGEGLDPVTCLSRAPLSRDRGASQLMLQGLKPHREGARPQ